jgi:hypothetical protein
VGAACFRPPAYSYIFVTQFREKRFWKLGEKSLSFLKEYTFLETRH